MGYLQLGRWRLGRWRPADTERLAVGERVGMLGHAQARDLQPRDADPVLIGRLSVRGRRSAMNLPVSIKRALSQPRRESVERLEREVLKLPQVDLRTTHVLAGCVYARTIFIPAGTVLTGAVHKKDHVNVV